MKPSIWLILLLAVTIIPTFLYYKSLGLKRFIVPALMLALAYKAGAR